MSTKRIKYYESRDIARKIANKAFEHLINPLEQKMKALAEDATETELMFLGGRERLVAAQLLHKSDGELSVAVRHPDRSDDTSDIYVKVQIGLGKYGYDAFALVSSSLYDALQPLNEDLLPLLSKHAALFEELHSQLEGKSMVQAIKAWPEAESIIREALGDTSGKPMVQPLEQLLARFLPMLPAPQTEEV